MSLSTKGQRVRAYRLTRARVGAPKIFVRHLSLRRSLTFSANDVNNNYDFARRLVKFARHFAGRSKVRKIITERLLVEGRH